MSNGVNILMATYNGEKFVAEQIKSIIHQSYTNWKLFIRDDCSTDKTPEILAAYQQADDRITIIKDDLGNLKSVQNFSLLLNTVKNDNNYHMFADQDDFWKPTKIEETLHYMLSAENFFGAVMPLLVFTNFSYVDENLHIIKTKKNFNALKIKDLRFSHLLLQNPVYGCTMMINNELAKLVNHIPDTAVNHDSWIAITAAAFGNISYLNRRTILYRQHKKNISGQHDNNSFKKRIKRIFINGENLKDVYQRKLIANAFLEKYNNQLTTKQVNTIKDFLNLFDHKNINLYIKNMRNGVRKQTVGQTLLFYATLFFNKSYNN